MAVSEEYSRFILERLEFVGDIFAKKMFGGLGIYLNGVFFALVANNLLYFKVDDTNRSDFKDAEMEAFYPFGGKSYKMSYYEVPADVIDDDALLRKWADKAFQAAFKNAAKKKKR